MDKFVYVSILVFPYCSKEFHVHVVVLPISLIVVLAQPGEDEMDHPYILLIASYL